MPERIQQDIDLFFERVADLRKRINRLSESEHFRRILLICLLDALAKCAFPEERSNRKRFVCLIDCYSQWEYKDYVSLAQLQELLFRKTEAKECQALKREVESRISTWPRSRILRPDEADLLVEKLDQFEQCKELIAKARYASLLWDMRNFAVHEFRTPGQGVALSNDNSTPYYHGLLDVQSQHSWELYIPSDVISRLVLSCSDNLKKDFKQKKRNPWDSFKFGSSWFSD